MHNSGEVALNFSRKSHFRELRLEHTISANLNKFWWCTQNVR